VSSAATVELLQSPTCADLRFGCAFISLFLKGTPSLFIPNLLWISSPANELRRLSTFVHGYPDLTGSRVVDTMTGQTPFTGFPPIARRTPRNFGIAVRTFVLCGKDLNAA
jgi:hypothetical protein